MEENKPKRGRPRTGTTPRRFIRIKGWEKIPAKNKSGWVNKLIDDELARLKRMGLIE